MIDRATLLALKAATLATRAAVAGTAELGRASEPPPTEGPLSILLVAHYPASNAGTRCRLLNWKAPLEARGHRVDVALPSTSARAERLYRTWTLAARAEYHLRLLANRLQTVRQAGRAHVVLLHLNDLPHWEYGPPFIAQALARRTGRLVLDLDDLPVVRGASSVAPRVRALAAAVDGFTLGNRFLREHFQERPAWRVPTCVDPGAWPEKRFAEDAAPPVLGWIGTSGNLRALEALAPQLAAVQRATGAKVRVVCDRPATLPGVEAEFEAWTLAGEQAAVSGFDIGLAPLADGPMQRCKCGLKALQYMAAGLPVIASPVGVLPDIVEDGSTGFVAGDPAAWGAALTRLAGDGELRREFGLRGRERAARDWSYARHVTTLEAALRGSTSTW